MATTNTSALLKTFLTCLLILLYSLSEADAGNGKGNNPKNSSAYCLDISGKISASHKKDNHVYKVELIEKNRVVQTLDLNDHQSFHFKLKPNSNYGIRITKQGHLPKLVSVDTDMPEEASPGGIFRLHFDTDLLSEDEKENLNQDALDFPIAVIHYNEETGWFYYNEEYTSFIKRKLYGKN